MGKFLELKKQVGKPMLTDPISDMLTRIRNAYSVSKKEVELPLSKMKYGLAKLMETNGYLAKVEQFQDGNKPMMRIELKYENKQPAISSIRRISKPGRRVYKKVDDLRPVRSGFGVSIISTPNGLMTNNEAKKRRLGGEVICEII